MFNPTTYLSGNHNKMINWKQVGKSFLQKKGDSGMAGSTKKEEKRGRYTAMTHKAT
jgi:hypothetical protein